MKKTCFLAMICALLIMLLTQGCLAQDVEMPADPEYVDYSSDRSTVFFNTSGNWSQKVFFDFFYPFDTSLRLEYYDALIQYEMDHEAFQNEQGQWMVALSDVSKLYAPYLTYGIQGDTLTVRHMLVTKVVNPEDSGLRSPRLNYTKYIWEASYSLAEPADVQVTRTTYVPFTTQAAKDVVEGLAAAEVENTEKLEGFALTQAPVEKDGEWYVPVAEFMAALGKVCAQEGDYLGIRTEIPNIPIASANNVYTGWQKISEQEMTWADYMTGVLEGTIQHGHFWKAFYVGTEDVYTGEGFSGQDDPKETMTINRILPYNVYIPETYNPETPCKLNITLHGSTGNENAAFERLSSRGMNIEDEADAHGYIVLCPNAWTRGPQWYKGPARYSFLKSIEMVCADYNVDQERMFLCGNSLGGKGTWDLLIRYPEMFVACSVQAPASAFMDPPSDEQIAAYRERAAQMPVLFVNGTADVTIPFATATSPWIYNVAKRVIDKDNAWYMTVEEGHHSYAYGSALEVMFDFFDRVLEGEKEPAHDFDTLTITANNTVALLDTTEYTLAHAVVDEQGTAMIALSDLQSLYGPEFFVYDVSAYNTDPAQKADVKMAMYENTTVNFKVGETFLRVDCEVYEADVTEEQKEKAQDNLFETRTLPVPAAMYDGELYVPAKEFMAVFDRNVLVK